MKNDDKLYYMGYQHGISDQCNKYNSLVANINAMVNHPYKKVYPAKYLEGYGKGYEETKGKFWYIVSIVGKKVANYYADGKWVPNKEEATKFPTRAALEVVIKRIPGFKAGSTGMRLE